jgi:hypothetical protein
VVDCQPLAPCFDSVPVLRPPLGAGGGTGAVGTVLHSHTHTPHQFLAPRPLLSSALLLVLVALRVHCEQLSLATTICMMIIFPILQNPHIHQSIWEQLVTAPNSMENPSTAPFGATFCSLCLDTKSHPRYKTSFHTCLSCHISALSQLPRSPFRAHRPPASDLTHHVLHIDHLGTSAFGGAPVWLNTLNVSVSRLSMKPEFNQNLLVHFSRDTSNASNSH